MDGDEGGKPGVKKKTPPRHEQGSQHKRTYPVYIMIWCIYNAYKLTKFIKHSKKYIYFFCFYSYYIQNFKFKFNIF
jgi:hypothetical protein